MIRPLPPFPALLIDGESKTLVVADLHLGFEFSLAEEGISIPSQMSRMRDDLLGLIDKYGPDTLLFLGDVKHNVPKISLQEWGDVPGLFDALMGRVDKIIVVRGNHDGRLDLLLPKGVEIRASSGTVLNEEVGLLHGHAWPNPRLLGTSFIVMAHNHPTVSIRTPFGFRILERVWFRAVCDGERLAQALAEHSGLGHQRGISTLFQKRYNVSISRKIDFVLMPAFNEILGGVAINRKPKNLIGPLFRSRLVDVEKAELYMLDGTFLGDVDRLRAFA